MSCKSAGIDALIGVVESGGEINDLALVMPDQRTTDLLYAAHRGDETSAFALKRALFGKSVLIDTVRESEGGYFVRLNPGRFGAHADKMANALLLATLRAWRASQ